MPTTNDHAIYYPSRDMNVQSLVPHFTSLAQSTDDALDSLDTSLKEYIDGLFAPSAAEGGRTEDSGTLNNSGENTMTLTTLEKVRGNPAPVLSGGGIQVRIPGTYFLNLRGQFDGSAPGYWRNANIKVNGDLIAAFASTASGSASRMFEGSLMLELDAGDIVTPTTTSSESSTGMRIHRGIKMTLTRVGPKGV